MALEKMINVLRHHRCYTVIVFGFCLVAFQKKVLAETVTSYVIKPYLESSLTYDANLLRLPKNYTAIMSGNRSRISDFIKQVKAGAAVKWQISQQQFIADLSINRNWFGNFTELDYTGYDLFGQWNWQVGRKLKGDFTYNHNFRLGGYQQINRLVTNLVNREKAIVRSTYEIVPDWYLHASFSYDYIHYPGLSRQQSDLIEMTKQFGFRYANELENSVDFYVKLADGKYPNRETNSTFGNAYSRIDYLLRGTWNYSVKTRLRAEIGYVSQKFPNVAARNFSNIVANADILWQPTVKSKVFIEVWRNINSIDNLTASFSLNQGFRITPTWTWSEKPKLQIGLPTTYEQQNSLGSSISRNVVSNSQTASQFSTSLNINYEPIPSIKMTAFVTYESRNADPTSTYQDHLVGITVQGSF